MLPLSTRTRPTNRPAVIVCAGATAVVALVSQVAAAQQADTFSPVVSYQYHDSLAESEAVTPITSYQYYDWPGDENLLFTNTPNVSYRYDGPPTIITQPTGRVLRVGETLTLSVVADGTPRLTYQWRLNGVPLPNTDSATIQLANAQQANSGAYSVAVSNAYSPPAVSADALVAVYESAPGPTPSPPALQGATRLPGANLTAAPPRPPSTQLRLFNRNSRQFEAVPQQSLLGKVAVVMTHGWQSSADGWPKDIAQAMSEKYGENVLVFAWDWRTTAATILPTSAAHRTRAEGEALGAALISALGQGYSGRLHFIGHSLGTLVNCRAADYVHGDAPNKPTKHSGAFAPGGTHITLLDEAEVAVPVKGLRTTFDVVLGIDNLSGAVPAAKVVPTRTAYVDNYISEVGLIQSSAENVLLWRNIGGPVALHGYSYEWYTDSVRNPLASLSGHRWSFERGTLGAMSQIGSYWLQSIRPGSSPLEVTRLSDDAAAVISNSRLKAYAGLNAYRTVVFPSYEAYTRLRTAGTKIGGAYLNGIQYAGNMLANFVETIRPPAGNAVYGGTAGSTPTHFVSSGNTGLGNLQAHWDLRFSISSGAPRPGQVNAPISASGVDSADSAVVYTILPFEVPREAVGMSFEYAIEGAATGEFMTAGIGDTNFYTMEAEYVEQGSWNAVPVIDVSDFRGQTVEVVFAYNGAAAPPAGTLSIRNVEFYVPERPQLHLQVTGSQINASWPLAATDWVLEANDDLTNPNGWTSVDVTPAEAEYLRSVTVDITGEKKFFFRLRK